MANMPTGERMRFLFRTDQGRVDRDLWRRAALWLCAILAILFAPWPLLSPYAFHDLSKSPFFVPMTALTYAYAIFLTFFGVLIAVSYINLSAKRFRDIGRPAPLGLASLLPLAAFLAGAAHWFQTLVEGVVPRWQVYPFDAAFVLVALWSVYELGFAPGKEP